MRIVFVVLVLCVAAVLSAQKKEKRWRRSATETDKETAQKTWPGVYANKEDNGAAILKAFLDNANAWDMFPKFKDIPHDETAMKNPTFRMHAGKIMSNMNTAIKNLNNPTKVDQMFKSLGKQHKSRGVNKKHVVILFDTIIGTLRDVFNLPADQLDSWKAVTGDLSQSMQSGIDS